MLVLAGDPLGQVERTQVIFMKDATSAAAAIFCVAFFTLLALLLRMQVRHAKVLADLHEEHERQTSALHTADRERAVKLEITLHGLLEMIEDFRVISYDIRRRMGPKPRRGEGTNVTPAGGIAAQPPVAGDFPRTALHIDPKKK